MSATAMRTERPPRGRVWLYAIAFVMLLVAGWLQVKGNLNSNLRQVGWSIGLSVAAVVVAVASVVVPGRRRRPTADAKPAAPKAATGIGSIGSAPNPTPGPDPETPEPGPTGSTTAEVAEPKNAAPEEPKNTAAAVREEPAAEPEGTDERPPSVP